MAGPFIPVTGPVNIIIPALLAVATSNQSVSQCKSKSESKKQTAVDLQSSFITVLTLIFPSLERKKGSYRVKLNDQLVVIFKISTPDSMSSLGWDHLKSLTHSLIHSLILAPKLITNPILNLSS